MNFFYPVEKPEMMKIGYKDESGEVEVENDPVLNKYTDYSSLKDFMNRLISLLRDLMSKRKNISSIKFNDQDLLEKNDFSKLLVYAVNKYRDVIISDMKKGIITEAYIRNRLSNIDENTANQLLQVIEISGNDEKKETNTI